MTLQPDVDTIESAIHVICGRRVMLDADLARLYGVPTKRLNEQVSVDLNWSQIATSSQRNRRTDPPPLAFTEHGCLMLANVLRSGHAVVVSVLIIRALVRLRSALAGNAELTSRVDALAREVERQSGKLATHDAAILKLLAEIRRLTQFPENPRRGIGFTAEWPEGT